MKRLLVILVTAALGACASYPQLEPAPGATLANGHRVVSEVDGVDVSVRTDAWKSDRSVLRYTTPVQVTVENHSDRPVTLRYQDFALVADDGRVFSALPPFEIEGTIREPAGRVLAHPIYRTPGFIYDRFYVSPYYRHFYPSLTPFPGRFYYDPFYYDTYFTVWRDVDLPTDEMLERALPEGVVQPAGRVSGLIYFQPVDRRADTVEFRFDLVDSSDGDVFGEVSIPLQVD